MITHCLQISSSSFQNMCCICKEFTRNIIAFVVFDVKTWFTDFLTNMKTFNLFRYYLNLDEDTIPLLYSK